MVAEGFTIFGHWELGNWAWGMGHGAWGMETRDAPTKLIIDNSQVLTVMVLLTVNCHGTDYLQPKIFNAGTIK
ncbi:MAG: hypothetical protein AAFS12_07430 [Cyanobacteria bacterium J06632_19]